MTEERITETTDSQGNTHTTHIVHEGGSGGGAAKWVFLLILVVAVAVGAYVMTQTNASEIQANEVRSAMLPKRQQTRSSRASKPAGPVNAFLGTLLLA